MAPPAWSEATAGRNWSTGVVASATPQVFHWAWAAPAGASAASATSSKAQSIDRVFTLSSKRGMLRLEIHWGRRRPGEPEAAEHPGPQRPKTNRPRRNGAQSG